MTLERSRVDGILYDDLSSNTVNPGLKAGRKLKYHGQTGNTVAGQVANQGIGTVAAPVLAAGATGTLTITDSLITTTSLIFTAVRRGTTTPAAGAYAQVTDCQAPASGSAVLDLWNPGAAATLSTDYQVWYLVVN